MKAIVLREFLGLIAETSNKGVLSSSHDLVKSVVDPRSKMEAKIWRKSLGLISKLVHSSSHNLAKSVLN